MANTLTLAFWNLENLFDTENAPRSDKLQRRIANDIAGWNATLLGAKLGQLSKVIRTLGPGGGPDLLGVCEVESKAVLEKLSARIQADGGRAYAVAHADTGDGRGIDVAFLYDPLVLSAHETFSHWVVKRESTRDLFQVNFKWQGRELIAVGNHWPSRSAGQYESEPYRMTAAETLAYWVQRICEEKGKDTAIVALGDFNDEPFNRSLMEYALALNDLKRVTSPQVQNRYLMNLMWPLLARGEGTHFYESRWNMLDQILISPGLASGASGLGVHGEARIEARALMGKGAAKTPWRFGIKPTERDTQGFSDHFPLALTLKKI